MAEVPAVGLRKVALVAGGRTVETTVGEFAEISATGSGIGGVGAEVPLVATVVATDIVVVVGALVVAGTTIVETNVSDTVVTVGAAAAVVTAAAAATRSSCSIISLHEAVRGRKSSSAF